MGIHQMYGTIFDIKQFAVFDGPGIRTTVFLKGCPLRCEWCHNPEGLSFGPQLMVSKSACTHCGRCREVCPNPSGCTVCGRCIRSCPLGLRRICGKKIDSADLAAKLLKDWDYLKLQGGGVTFSGGEPTAQGEFLLECLRLINPMHKAIETSGYCDPDLFREIIGELDYVIMDIKHTDDEIHRRYTKVSNRKILQNLEQLKTSGKPFRIRIPVIPGVNDTEDNFRRTAELLAGAENLDTVELLPYHQTAGAKYEMVDMDYRPSFDTDALPNLDTAVFAEYHIPCKVI